MANPQVEDGRIEVANELGDALAKTYFSPAENKVFWAVLRKTYGWHKKSDAISYSQLAEATGLDRRHVGPALKRLVSRRILWCNSVGQKRINEYGVQKDYDLWLLAPEMVTKSDTDTGVNLPPISVPDGEANLTPITVPSDTGLGQSDTDTGVKSDTDLSTHKSNKASTKAIDKSNGARATPKNFEVYKASLKERFPELDFDLEFEKYRLYWYEGQRGPPKSPKLALLNWLTKAREINHERGTGNERNTNGGTGTGKNSSGGEKGGTIREWGS
jgi:phage replication O-like protein O